jgi:nicotinamide mononucleotide transporter
VLNPLEILGAVLGIAAVFLAARQHVWNWPLGIVNFGLYIVVFYQAKLYAQVGLQVVYIVLAGYGWWNWLHGGANRGELRVSRVGAREALLLTLAFALATPALAFVLTRATDAALPFADSALTAASLVAQYMMTRKYVECWLVWLAADVAYVALFIHQSLWPTVGLYAVFCALAIMGWRDWRASLRRQTADAVAA